MLPVLLALEAFALYGCSPDRCLVELVLRLGCLLLPTC
jgi:hypothetical protein